MNTWGGFKNVTVTKSEGLEVQDIDQTLLKSILKK
jgi:hypothetical protein